MPSLGKKILRVDQLPSDINLLAASDSSCIVKYYGSKLYIALSEYRYSADLDGKFRWKQLVNPTITITPL